MHPKPAPNLASSTCANLFLVDVPYLGTQFTAMLKLDNIQVVHNLKIKQVKTHTHAHLTSPSPTFSVTSPKQNQSLGTSEIIKLLWTHTSRVAYCRCLSMEDSFMSHKLADVVCVSNK
ncbi:hypothetical protein OS493_035901 [Desmophyllum pertusum]|uniref:Uncharacterized protein n=1 Tax=Desmophyllum pertusum TaxID=174260 RepID=A0A9W9Z7G4_9CNID|nr:hypothetical protein OS493_035901 [Desmophyllum pertusum]